MSFPTATTWCVGTISSLVATMTRRSGSGTAGDRLCLAEAQRQGSHVLFPFFGRGVLVLGLAPGRLSCWTSATQGFSFQPQDCLGLGSQDLETPFPIITTF